MGDAESGPVRLSFNSQLRVEFRGATVTSDAGLLLPRVADAYLFALQKADRGSECARAAREILPRIAGTPSSIPARSFSRDRG